MLTIQRYSTDSPIHRGESCIRLKQLKSYLLCIQVKTS
ncbi:hypothetical protein Desac_2287 [Desulfobacca acetoxidans DSM 11109]|uniref:Uncharacterized protein n=1 Tax=Desulfobacca acetoxidans (strain ATCC 700848 / DSM 11109 / ASRB2) TaxID=880072 RepID=F2NFJ2_DESAR|nr:hypothetical protein Desac_2287 [Desulfobacca acetoxidans DSM 11109]